MPRPTIALIDIAAMQHNLRATRARAPHAWLWAVVKANAYGHGLERAMRGFSEADGMALLELEAAKALRELGWQKPILLLEGFFEAADLPFVFDAGLDFAVHSVEQIEMIECFRHTGPFDVHLKMNTGMNRLGFAPEAFRQAYARLRALPMVRNIVCMTHMANADALAHPALSFQAQCERFREGMAGLPGPISLANSASVLFHPEAHTDSIRPGVMLYGASPGMQAATEFGLIPCMTLQSRIIGLQNVRVGEVVGYGSRFIVDKPMRIGVVACGYADGYPCHAPDGTPVWVEGQCTRLVGRVSMDMLTVDLTDVPNADFGSLVELWGKNLSIDTVAQAAGTIGFELMCALGARVRTEEIAPEKILRCLGG